MIEPRPPLRALIVTDYYRPLIGGSIQSLEQLARHLTARGHTVEIATSWQPGLAPVETLAGVRVHRLRDVSSRMRWVSEDPYKHNPPPFPDPELSVRMRRLIRRFQPDLVHTYGWISHSAAAALLGTKIPLLLSARDYGNICALGTLVRKGELCSGPAPAKCLACAGSRYGAAKGTVAVASVFAARPLLRSRTTQLHAVSRFVGAMMDRYLRIPQARSVVIPNFHEDEAGRPVDPALLAQLPQEPFILFVGAFRRIKGIDELFAAYGSLENPPPLVLVGTRMTDTPERFPDGVTVITDVPHATVMAIWERSLFGVSPTVAPEPLGNVVHEAMSCGRAMIGTRPGGHEDMIEDGETGLLVPAGDSVALAQAMARLIEEPELRERIGTRARERAKMFTPQSIIPRLENLYYDTVSLGGDDSRTSAAWRRTARAVLNGRNRLER
ncbi:MAG TPA: glycosyltransferase family 4 protein [Solirubrobacteraceae bacterium]